MRLDATQEEIGAITELLDAGQGPLCARHLMPRLANPTVALAWLALSWEKLLRIGNADLPHSLLHVAALDDDLAPLKARLLAQWAMLFLPPEEATAHVLAVDDHLFGAWRAYALAQLALRGGQEEQGTRQLFGLWQHMAWHPQLTLKLRTLRAKTAPAPDDLSDTAVLLYSWNKADLLGDTLDSLAVCDLRGARVFVLDNGSTDHMAARIAKAAKLFPEGQFQSLTLPVNVGAPAARNWLLSLPEVRACTYAAFLDDDVIIPPNWLTHLRSAAEQTRASVIGCRVTSAQSPRTVQSADYHLLPPTDSVKTFVDYPEKVMVFESCANDFDLGLYTYARPATSVSGCCHLLSLESVRQCGDFDIRFTPTQFDDLERDLRLGCANMDIHYAGDLNIRHIQHSSLAKAQSLKSIGHVFGNKIKLEGKYDLEQIRSLQSRMATRLETDLREAEDELLAEVP